MSTVFPWWEAVASPLLWAAAGWRSNRCDCHFDGDVCSVNSELLEVLRSQLDCCGPERLSCPGCPLVVCPGASALPIAGAFVGGGVVGGLLVIALAARRTRAPATAGRFEFPVITTPASRKVRG